MLKLAPEGAGRMDHLHGDEDQVDPERYLEPALEEVVEIIMNFGQWPQPRRVGTFITTGSNAPKLLDLYDCLADRIDYSELLEYFILSLNDRGIIGPFSDSRARWEKRVEKMLVDHLTGSELVADHAAKLMRDEREER